MLVLSRRPHEEIVINDNIRIKILSVRGDKVKVGIAAPDGVAVHRSEVYERLAEFETRHSDSAPVG